MGVGGEDPSCALTPRGCRCLGQSRASGRALEGRDMAPRSWGELPGLKVKALSGSGRVTFPLQSMLLTASAHLSAVQTAVVSGLGFCNLKRSQGRRHRWPVGHHGPQDLNHPALWPLRPGGWAQHPSQLVVPGPLHSAQLPGASLWEACSHVTCRPPGSVSPSGEWDGGVR